MKSFLPLFACLLTASADAAVTIVRSSITSTIIPDYNFSGYTNAVTVTADSGDVPPLQEIYHITHVTVNLVFSDGWNGDLYVYLVHGDTMAMLLNRVGRENGVEDGSGSTGINITLDDNAPLDVHTLAPSSGPYAGTYASDGRLVDPDDVTGADPRTATLSDFIGDNPTGDWTLFVADVGFGNQSTLESWTLTVTAIPEPTVPMLLCAFTPLAILRRNRKP
ncbi:proprotein convertase P-domain-containing protein [Luteolibacter yonseiensis]|uniref:Proprotein convertase P-domain-containing protein n=1 Tax=Luteolibacter yonseiensis TaxID=1144680 RepID=A0A934R8W6_9BACT|nr:proprotein convertase P-domain-containing protein [Luteolibacter yonseiensis]MBK1818068.1 proprotein convertase P-domain-containing protein [Luteolibacter yonseiensis]